MAPKTIPIDIRIAKYTNKTGTCWLWTGGIYPDGYPRIALTHTKTVRVSRYLWEQSNGPIPDGLYVLHKCDNPLCVNIQHMFLGTQQDNMTDMINKHRQYRPIGEIHYRTNLTTLDIILIRYLHSCGITYEKLARSYNMSCSAISAISLGRRWSHVNYWP